MPRRSLPSRPSESVRPQARDCKALRGIPLVSLLSISPLSISLLSPVRLASPVDHASILSICRERTCEGYLSPLSCRSLHPPLSCSFLFYFSVTVAVAVSLGEAPHLPPLQPARTPARQEGRTGRQLPAGGRKAGRRHHHAGRQSTAAGFSWGVSRTADRGGVGGGVCLTARQEMSRQRVGLASPDNSDAHDSNAGHGPASTRPQDCASARPGRPVLLRRRSYRRHSGGDWRRRAAVPVEDRSRRTSREPTAGVMDRRRSGQRSDSESRSLRTAGLDNLPGRATHLLRLE
jgi:hypothetical protein